MSLNVGWNVGAPLGSCVCPSDNGLVLGTTDGTVDGTRDGVDVGMDMGTVDG